MGVYPIYWVADKVPYAYLAPSPDTVSQSGEVTM